MPTECNVVPMGFARVDGRSVAANFAGGAITLLTLKDRPVSGRASAQGTRSENTAT